MCNLCQGRKDGGDRGAPNPKDPPLEALPGMALAVAPIEKGLEAGAAPAKIHILAEAMVTLEQGKMAKTVESKLQVTERGEGEWEGWDKI
jgi:hypothetical protein